MALLALLAAIALWTLLDVRSLLRDRANWPLLAVALLGIVLLAGGRPLVGGALVVAVALWSRRPRRARTVVAGGFAPQADRVEAATLLGVAADADRATILAAQRRLIARNHPDNGGTQGLAARLNAARDIMLNQSQN
jgi:hypothetical protein